jgi:hypothetical protein
MRLPRSIELFLILFFICMTVALVVNAQTPPPSGGSSVGAPIDGMVGLLLAAGVGYGIKRSREQK